MRRSKIIKKTRKEAAASFGTIILEVIAPYLNRGANVLHKVNHKIKSKFIFQSQVNIAQQS